MNLPSPARAADPPITVENIRVGFSATARQGQFKVGTWTPVWVDLKGGPQRFQGRLVVVVPDDDGTPTVATQIVDIAPRDFKTFVVYVRPGTRNPTISARVVDESGRTRSNLLEDNDLGWVEAGQLLIGTLGNPSGVEEVPGLPGFSGPNSGAGNSELVVTRIRVPEGMPGRWYGYDACEAVILDTNDPRVMEVLSGSGTQLQALEGWVRRGGHLVVAVGSSAQVARETLGSLLPALPGEQTRLSEPAALESFAAASASLKSLLVTHLEPVEGRGAKVLAATASAKPINLVVRGPVGLGRVTVVGLDVDQKPFSDWADRKLFWIKALDLRGRAEATGSANPVFVPAGGGSFYRLDRNDLSALLHLSLEDFPGVTLVPFGWVAFFVFLYILLIGPGDYFFLKKVVKRMELTWITFPLIVLGVSALAYAAAYYIKGTDLRINKVDAVDIDQAEGKGVTARGQTWLTLFSPQNRDYTLTINPLPLDRLPGGTAAPSRGMRANAEILLSWFGGPDPVFGGGSRIGLSSNPYRYEPTGEAEQLAGVRVAIWSTKSFIGRWSCPSAPVVDAQLRVVGLDRVAGTITNRLQRPLKDAFLAYGRQIYPLDTIAPGATVTIDTNRNRLLAGYLEERARNFNAALNQPNNINWNGGSGGLASGSRADLIRAILFRDAMASKGGAPTSTPLRHLDLTGQLALDRPMLVAEIDGPAAALELGRAPSTPKIEQTTVLRVILPPIAPEGEAPGK
ncbi:MAG: hypothetical protein IRY99_18230 [Isosphaeraceae bacterium]|nr:hypothetical protein [Isosphaeraceae bacterium]